MIAEEKESAEEKVDEESLAPLCELLQKALESQIAEVRVSARLTDSAACLVSPEDSLSPQMEQMMRAMGQEVPDTKRSEVNGACLDQALSTGRVGANEARVTEFGDCSTLKRF